MFHVKQNHRETSVVLFTKLKNAIFYAKIISKIKKKHHPKKLKCRKTNHKPPEFQKNTEKQVSKNTKQNNGLEELSETKDKASEKPRSKKNAW